MSATPVDTDASIGSNSMRVEEAAASVAKRDPIWPMLVILLGLLASVTWTGFLAWGVSWVMVRVTSPSAGVDFFNQYWPYDFFSQYWPYGALAVPVLMLLWKTGKRISSVEAKVKRLRADLAQIQQIESRRLFQEMKSASVIETNGSSVAANAPRGDGGEGPTRARHRRHARKSNSRSKRVKTDLDAKSIPCAPFPGSVANEQQPSAASSEKR